MGKEKDFRESRKRLTYMVGNVQGEFLQGRGEITKRLLKTEMLILNINLLKLFQALFS